MSQSSGDHLGDHDLDHPFSVTSIDEYTSGAHTPARTHSVLRIRPIEQNGAIARNGYLFNFRNWPTRSFGRYKTARLAARFQTLSSSSALTLDSWSINRDRDSVFDLDQACGLDSSMLGRSMPIYFTFLHISTRACGSLSSFCPRIRMRSIRLRITGHRNGEEWSPY